MTSKNDPKSSVPVTFGPKTTATKSSTSRSCTPVASSSNEPQSTAASPTPPSLNSTPTPPSLTSPSLHSISKGITLTSTGSTLDNTSSITTSVNPSSSTSDNTTNIITSSSAGTNPVQVMDNHATSTGINLHPLAIEEPVEMVEFEENYLKGIGVHPQYQPQWDLFYTSCTSGSVQHPAVQSTAPSSQPMPLPSSSSLTCSTAATSAMTQQTMNKQPVSTRPKALLHHGTELTEALRSVSAGRVNKIGYAHASLQARKLLKKRLDDLPPESLGTYKLELPRGMKFGDANSNNLLGHKYLQMIDDNYSELSYLFPFSESNIY